MSSARTAIVLKARCRPCKLRGNHNRGDPVEEAEGESLVDVAKSVISNPVNFGHRIRDLCCLMSQYLEARIKECYVRRSMAEGQTECSELFIVYERARILLFETLVKELRTLQEVTHLARRKSVEIERFMTKFCLPVWRETLGRDPFGKIRIALDALDNVPYATDKNRKVFDGCREALSCEVEVFIQVLKVSPEAKQASKKESARNRDGKITATMVQKVRDEIKRFRESNDREPTRTELRDCKFGIARGGLQKILDQLVNEGTYHQPARKRRQPEQL